MDRSPTPRIIDAGTESCRATAANQVVAFSGPEQWQEWITSVDQNQAIYPQFLIAGHKPPDVPDDQAAPETD